MKYQAACSAPRLYVVHRLMVITLMTLLLPLLGFKASEGGNRPVRSDSWMAGISLVLEGVPDAYAVAQGATLTIPAPGVLSNDTGGLVARLTAVPARGTVDFRADGSFTYTHDGDGTATDAFTYQISDGLTTSGPITVTIDVMAISFATSKLDGHTMTLPSSLQFGPDGRLYGLRKLGQINVMQIEREGPGDYRVADEEIITLIRGIKNHDDDGYPNSDKNRQATGILVTGTPSNPVLYVTSSDNRVGGGSEDPDTWLDTNSGVLSRITWVGVSRNDVNGYWDKVDLVRGLPRSEENHASNGMEMSATGDTLFVTSGGFTNAGAPSKNLAFINEYALSGAILSVHLPTLNAMPTRVDVDGIAYKYDLPTLDDPTRPNVNGITDPSIPGYDGIDVDDPWGGNDGLNQAKLVPGGPVQIYSPGYRNLYDIVITKTPGRTGRMYGIDNGANRGWGGHPVGEGGYPGASAGVCTNNFDPTEPGSIIPGRNDPPVNNENGLHYIRTLQPGEENYAGPDQPYYAGHPNPVRGNPAGAGLYTGDYDANPEQNTGVWRDGTDAAYPLPVDWPPVPVSMAYEAECDFRNSGETDGALVNFKYSTNGITEYTASNFNNVLKGNLLAVAWNETEVYRIILDEAGKVVQNETAIGTGVLASGFGKALLDVTAVGDDGVFPGTVWVADFSGHEIYVLEPADYGGTSAVLAASSNLIRFGPVQPGEEITKSITLSNEGGTLPLTVSGMAIEGVNTGAFEVDFSGSITLEKGESRSVDVTFTPEETGTKVARVVITHTGVNGTTNIDVAGLASDMSVGTALRFRVNAGGPLLPDGPNHVWEEDRAALGGSGDVEAGTPHAYINASAMNDKTYGLNDPITLSASVPAGTSPELFQSARWDVAGAANMQWDIPVPAGKKVEVRLYFAEQIFTAPQIPDWHAWPREFDVSIEGTILPAMKRINIFEDVGHDTGMVRSVVVESDGNVDINFIDVMGDPMLQAIEVLEVYAPYQMVDDGWNMLGVPAGMTNENYATVFSDVAPVFEPLVWTGSGYETTETVNGGQSYWLLAEAGRMQVLHGLPVQSLSFDLEAGWNMITGPHCTVPFGAVSDPGAILTPGTLYGYKDEYVASESLEPGYGYWVRASSAGTISMDCAAAGKKLPTSQKAAIAEEASLTSFGLLHFEDAEGASQTLYFGGILEEDTDIHQFAMPPLAPEGSFDVRYTTDLRLIEKKEGLIRTQAIAYPMTVTLDRLPADFEDGLRVDAVGTDGVLHTHTLSIGQSFSIADPSVTGLRINAGQQPYDEHPERFALAGNFPNPFNPTTTVIFDLPDDAEVQLSVYDMLGKRVLQLPMQAMTAGRQRQMVLDASALASGMYVYQVEAMMASATEIGIGKLILLK